MNLGQKHEEVSTGGSLVTRQPSSRLGPCRRHPWVPMLRGARPCASCCGREGEEGAPQLVPWLHDPGVSPGAAQGGSGALGQVWKGWHSASHAAWHRVRSRLCCPSWGMEPAVELLLVMVLALGLACSAREVAGQKQGSGSSLCPLLCRLQFLN